jgi:hypothetical protein
MKAGKVLLSVVALVLAAFAAIFWLSGPPGDDLHVRKVLIDVSPAAIAATVDREQVRRIVGDVLTSTRGVVVDEANDGLVLRVRVESFSTTTPADLESHPAGISTSSLSLFVEVVENDRSGGRGHSVATAQGQMNPDALMAQALRDAIRQIQQARAANSLDSETLLGWLSDDTTSESQRRQAMLALVSRNDRRVTPSLVRLLNSSDEGMATASLQALTVLADPDPDAVDAIINHSARQPPLVRRMCIEAVKASGSPRAVPWLFTLTTGHPDAEVQAAARAAMAALAPELVASPGNPRARATGG